MGGEGERLVGGNEEWVKGSVDAERAFGCVSCRIQSFESDVVV